MNHHPKPVWPRILLVIFWLLPTLMNPVQLARASGVWYVSPQGNDANSCATPAQACATVNRAIAQAAAADTVRVASGTYFFYNQFQVTFVEISKNITLSGGWDSTFTLQSGDAVVIMVGHDRVTKAYGIHVPKNVTALVERVKIQDVRAVYGSAAIHNEGTLTLKESVLFRNSTLSYGAAIFNSGEMQIVGCTLEQNLAHAWGGGILNTSGSTLSIENSVIRGNTSLNKSGGIHNDPDARLTIKASIITQNSAEQISGGIGNQGELEITGSVISENETHGADSMGGGIGNWGELKINASTVSANKTQKAGGGLFNAGEAEVSNSNFIHNTSQGAGGALANQQVLRLTNTTISLNESLASGGGIFNQSEGDTRAVLQIANSTVSHNTAGKNGGLAHESGNTTLRNTLVAENSAETAPDCGGVLQSAGYNLVGDPSGCDFTPAAGDLLGVNPQLMLLAEWLGYNPLKDNSPAIDAGNPTGCQDSAGAALLADQRGAPRQGVCDIGAFEYTSPGPLAEILPMQGDGQETLVNAAFPVPLQGLMLDALRSPLPDQAFTLLAPTSGAGATFDVNGSTELESSSDEWGMTGLIYLTANSYPGNYTLEAHALGSTAQRSFVLTNRVLAYLPIASQYFCSYGIILPD